MEFRKGQKIRRERRHVFVYTCNCVLGAVFVLSGLLKCIDPLGTAFKIEEYCRYFELNVLLTFSKELALILCLGEFTLGVAYFFGRAKAWTYPIMGLFLLGVTALTLYLALENPISDCGCFGDAIILSNWATFGKNVILLLLYLPAVISGRHLPPLLATWVTTADYFRYLGWSLCVAGFLCWMGMAHLPVIDFRPFKNGVNIAESMAHQTGGGEVDPDMEGGVTEEYYVIYERDGEQREFSLDELPDEESGWTFVQQVVRQVTPEGTTEVTPTDEGERWVSIGRNEIKDFSVTDIDYNDLTDRLLNNTEYSFLAVSYALNETSDASIEALNRAYNYARRQGYAFYCLTPKDFLQYRRWVERSGAAFPFIYGDLTTLETITRANPALILLKNGTIYWKKNLMDVDFEELESDRLENQTMGEIQVIDGWERFYWILALLIVPYLVLLLVRVVQSWRVQRATTIRGLNRS
jgi:hypothetical protein